jgi:hypothetical protein
MSLLIKKTLAILIIILSGFVGLTLTNEVRKFFLTVVLLISVFALLFIRKIFLRLVAFTLLS